ncbi:hypothetical protein KFE25_007573 [Diacronema lutheri]|uniref:Uncharacterized protein n=1 Tax=Diacronema lutheri TaxID=2081491 RepID=A0A8J6CGF6_DIALT|nr:hypothetical protein KFE25_007573 [Diacronema lutheri]
MSCLPFVELRARFDETLGHQIRRMAEIVSSDSLTRAFVHLSHRSDKATERIFLVDRATRRPLRVTSLAQLEVGKLYVFGEGHTLQRMAVDTVLLAGKIRIPLALGGACAPPPLRTMRTPEPELCRQLCATQARGTRAEDDAARARRERRVAEARAKRERARAAVVHSPAPRMLVQLLASDGQPAQRSAARAASGLPDAIARAIIDDLVAFAADAASARARIANGGWGDALD